MLITSPSFLEQDVQSLQVKRSRMKPTENVKHKKINNVEKYPRNEPLSLHSSVAPIVPSADIEIDPELDVLLAELENDDDFKRLPENEQKTWLESLFFLDTLHLTGRNSGGGKPRNLNPTKQTVKPTLRVNQSIGTYAEPVGPPARESLETAGSSVHLNEKMNDLAKDFFAPKSSDLKAESEKRSNLKEPLENIPEPIR